MTHPKEGVPLNLQKKMHPFSSQWWKQAKVKTNVCTHIRNNKE